MTFDTYHLVNAMLVPRLFSICHNPDLAFSAVTRQSRDFTSDALASQVTKVWSVTFPCLVPWFVEIFDCPSLLKVTSCFFATC